MIGTLPWPAREILIGLVVMVFTGTLLIPYLIIWVEHSKAQILAATELRGFVDSYSSTPEWAISAISVSVLSLTIGSDQSTYVDSAILLAFIFPAVFHLNRNFPFELWAEIEESEITPDDDGFYNIDLYLTTGSNIDEYFLDLDLPSGVAIQGFQGPSSEQRLTDDGQIWGEAPIDKDDFVLMITIKETTGVGYENLLRIIDLETDRPLTSVHLN